MSSKKKTQEPFVDKLNKTLNRECKTIIYPKLRVRCVKSLGSDETESLIYRICNGHRRTYEPAIQYALAHKKTLQGQALVDAYVTQTNREANLEPQDDPILTQLRDMTFKTTVKGCTEGARRCPKCFTTNLLPYSRQTRRPDELATTMFNCGTIKCPHHTKPFR